MTRADRILVVCVVGFALALIPVTVGLARSEGDVALISYPSGEVTVALTRDATYQVEGHLSEVEITVRSGGAQVTHASCPEGRCRRMAPASVPGDAVVCMPNGVTVSVPAGTEVDDVVR